MVSDKEFVKKFEQKVKSTIKKFNLISPKDKILVAVSGGKDSTAALYLLKKFGYGVEAVTVDAVIGSYTKENRKNIEKYCKENSFIARLFNVYGKYGKSFVNTLCEKIPSGKDIIVYDDGSKTRDYIHVDDVVSALLLGLEHNGIYNVGTGKETSVMDLIKVVEKMIDKKAIIRFAPENKSEIKNSRADITKIRKLGWGPKITLEEGIRRILMV